MIEPASLILRRTGDTSISRTAAFASGLDVIFLISAAVAVVAGLAALVLLRPLETPETQDVRPTGEPVAVA